MLETVQIHYRPLKIGFLIHANSSDEFIEATRLSTCLWGGMFNPIFEIGEDLKPLFHDIRHSRIDILCPIKADSVTKKVADHLPWLEFEFKIETILEDLEGEKKLIAQDVLPIFKTHWESNFKFDSIKSRCVQPLWEAKDPLNPFFSALFGSYFPGLTQNYVLAYKDMMRPAELNLDGKSIPKEFADAALPIDVTTHRLRPHHFGGRTTAGVYVGNPLDLKDLINFWNLRSGSSGGVVFYPASDQGRILEYANARIQQLADTYSGSERNDLLHIWFNKNEDAAKAFQDDFKSKLPGIARAKYSGVSSALWDNDRFQSLYRFPEQSVIVNAKQLVDGKPSFTVVLPPKPVSEDHFPRFSGQRWIVGIEAFERDTEYSLNPPYVPELNDWLRHECGVGAESVRIQPTGIDLIEKNTRDHLWFYPVSKRNYIAELFRHIGFKTEMSSSARVVNRLIEQMGGLQYGCRVFQIPGVRKLIEHSNSAKGVTRGFAKQTIFDSGSFKKFEDLYIEKREEKNLTTDAAFNYLLHRKVFRSGVRFKCPHCELELWIPVDEMAEQINCEFCGHEFLCSPQLDSSDVFRFRLTGLFGRNDHQQGAVPVILTLQRLLHFSQLDRHSMYCVGTNLNADGFQCESDFLLVYQNHEAIPTILIGECKTNTAIDSNDVRNLEKVYHQIVSKGYKSYMVFSKTSEFNENEKKLFVDLVKRQLPFVLFTEKELEPYYIADAYENVGGVPYPRPYDLNEVMANSIRRYLLLEKESSIFFPRAS